MRGCKPAPTLRGWPAALTAWRWGRRLPGSRRRSSGPGVTGELQNKAQNVQNLTDIDIRTGLCACPSVVAFPIFPPPTSTSAWAVLSTAPAEKQISRQHLDRARFQGSTAGPSSMSSRGASGVHPRNLVDTIHCNVLRGGNRTCVHGEKTMLSTYLICLNGAEYFRCSHTNHCTGCAVCYTCREKNITSTS